jgi:hypothetical protein
MDDENSREALIDKITEPNSSIGRNLLDYMKAMKSEQIDQLNNITAKADDKDVIQARDALLKLANPGMEALNGNGSRMPTSDVAATTQPPIIATTPPPSSPGRGASSSPSSAIAAARSSSPSPSKDSSSRDAALKEPDKDTEEEPVTDDAIADMKDTIKKSKMNESDKNVATIAIQYITLLKNKQLAEKKFQKGNSTAGMAAAVQAAKIFNVFKDREDVKAAKTAAEPIITRLNNEIKIIKKDIKEGNSFIKGPADVKAEQLKKELLIFTKFAPPPGALQRFAKSVATYKIPGNPLKNLSWAKNNIAKQETQDQDEESRIADAAREHRAFTARGGGQYRRTKNANYYKIRRTKRRRTKQRKRKQ